MTPTADCEFFERKGGKIAYRSSGAGDCIVLIHPLAMRQEFWDLQVREFSHRFRMLSYDLRGHGRSSAPMDGDYTFQALADDLIDLLDHLKIADAGICGISVGGEVAQMAAALHPNRFRRLLLVSTACYTDPARAAVWTERIQQASELGMAGIARATARRWFSSAYSAERPDVVEWCEKLVATTPLLSYQSLARVIQSMDLRAEIGSIRCPTSVICGDADHNTGPKTGQILANLIPGARLSVISGAGHFPNLEAPREFNALCNGSWA